MTTVTSLAAAIAMKDGDDPKHSRSELDSSSSSGDEDFQDAVEDYPPEGSSRFTLDLTTSLEQCEIALKRFLNNDLQGAMVIMKPWSRTSLYHSLATSIFEFIPAVLTLDPRQVDRALASIKHTVTLCQQYRRSYSLVESLGTIIRKPNFSTFTELEAHAELCYAETLLLQAALSLLDGEDLTGLVRATLKVKASHNSYKNCNRILQQRRWEDGRSRRDFESGVRLGLATFNVVISMLPNGLIVLLSFAGFSGNRAAGLAELERGSGAGGLRAPLCDLTLLAVQLVVYHFVAGNTDMRLAERILAARLQQFPEGAFFLLFLGRLQLLRGDTSAALATYVRVEAIPRLWPQLQQITYWECMWAYSIEMRWRDAAHFAGRLLSESAWSRTVYAYARAAFLLELPDLTPEEKQEVAQLLGRAATYRQRIAGKSLPMEKFVIRRCQRWASCGYLVHPGFELLCLWNMFPALAADENRVVAALQAINNAPGGAGRRGLVPPVPNQGQGLLDYLTGALNAAAGRIPQAIIALERVLLAILILRWYFRSTQLRIRLWRLDECDNGRLPRRLRPVREANERNGFSPRHVIRRHYSGYVLESRLLLRVHTRLDMIPEMPAEEEQAMREQAAEQQVAEEQQVLQPPPSQHNTDG